jgi:uncharacterized protein involved in high-affinity Fe2+ transport
MKVRITILIMAVASLGLTSCGIDDDPAGPEGSLEETGAEVTLLLKIQPPTSLRTLDTWNFWNLPAEVIFVAGLDLEGGGEGEHHDEEDGHGHGLLTDNPGVTVVALKADDEEEEGTLTASADLPGMRVTMSLEEGASLWELRHGGGLEEHHPQEGSNHLEVSIEETVTGHDAHGGTTISHCDVTLIAAPASGDTLEVRLAPVQSGHGYRYESNAELPPETYDLHLEIEPPRFLRMDSTHDKWSSHIEMEFHDFVFDDNFVSGTVGEELWVGDADDSLHVTLRAGSVKQYGAVGMGMVPLTGEETINFSLRLEDPSIEAHGQPLYGAMVSVTARDNDTGRVMTSVLKPMYGSHGFHFGDNMMLGFGHHHGGPDEDDDHHDDDDGHHGDGHEDDDDHDDGLR